MKGRDTLVNYKSDEGDRIKVVSGRVSRRSLNSGTFGIFSTRVYCNDELVREYYGRNNNLNLRDIPLVRPKLIELAECKAEIEEIVSALETYIALFAERDEIEKDDPTRFLEFE